LLEEGGEFLDLVRLGAVLTLAEVGREVVKFAGC
jgi:hypothetical protein